MKRSYLTHQFVEFVPHQLQEGVLYISITYATATHRCCCGCGHEVVTPLSQTDWTLFNDGESVSLDPSIGNWSLPCKSHYWIRNNRIRWAGPMPQRLIDAGRENDRIAKSKYYSKKWQATRMPQELGETTRGVGTHLSHKKPSFWAMLIAFLAGRE